MTSMSAQTTSLSRLHDIISQFTLDIRHLPGLNNAAADTLSRMDVDALEHTSHSAWDFHTLAAAQREDDRATAAASTSLDLQQIPLPTTDVTLLCDMATSTPRHYVPPNL